MNIISTTPNNAKMAHRKLFMPIIVAVCIIFGLLAPHDSYAAVMNGIPSADILGPDFAAEKAAYSDPNTSCTSTPLGFPTEKYTTDPTAMVTAIIIKIKLKLLWMSQQMYVNIILSSGFITAVRAAITLYISIYGILFMSGLVQMTVHDFIMRLIKIAIVGMMLSASSWGFFNDNVIRFFNGATDDLIAAITNSGNAADLSLPPLPASTNPILSSLGSLASSVIPTNAPTEVLNNMGAFGEIDLALNKVISNRMFVTLMAASLTGPYGPVMFAMLLVSVFLFMKSVMTAIWVYVMSLVMKTLLFGLAPIFIPTILFAKTKHLFDNWINQLVSISLQPVLLFAFYIFFVKLMEGSIDNILSHPVCWTKFPEGIRGSGFDFSFWRYMVLEDGKWVASEKEWSIADGYPIPIISILTLLTIAEISNRFNDVVIQVTMQISNASVSLLEGVGGGMSMPSLGGLSGGSKDKYKPQPKTK